MLPRFLRRGPQQAADTPDRGAWQALRAALDGDLAAAERALVALVDEDSAQIGGYLALGQIFRRRGELGRAIRVHQNLLLRSDLDEASRRAALEGLARDFEQGGFHARALAAWGELLAREPEHAGAHRARLALLATTRDFEGAEAERRELERAGARDLPSAAELALGAARAARSEGRASEARRAAKRALRADRSHAAAWWLLAELDEARGRKRRALAAGRRAATLDRFTSPAGYALVARLSAALGRERAHEEFLRALAEQRSDDAGPLLALARIRLAGGDAAGALTLVEAALTRDADDLDAHALRAEIVSSREPGSAAKALSELVEALARQGHVRGAGRDA